MTPPPAATYAPRRPVPAPERPHHLRVVPGGSASGRRPRRWLAITLVVAAVFSLVQSAVFTGQGSIARGRVESRVASLRADLAEVELAIVEATTPEALMHRARRLGLVFPSEVGVLDLSRPAKAKNPERKAKG